MAWTSSESSKLAAGYHNREWLQKTIVEGCCPLHPLATYCLPFLNRQLAQNERTMFSFIWDEKYGLKSFIEEADLTMSDGWLNLLSLDGLFPYFEMNIRERRLDLYFLYQQAKSKLLPEQVDIGLEGLLLRNLILCDYSGGPGRAEENQARVGGVLGLVIWDGETRGVTHLTQNETEGQEPLFQV